jgi:transketolase
MIKYKYIQMSSLRKKIIEASFLSGACHIGSALSCVEIIESIFLMKNPEDFFIFAKASGVATLYCKLHPEKAAKYLKSYPLPSKEVPGVIWSGGSLGMGLSIATGMALADRSRRVFCLISDGELQEGQTWEAIMFANQHKLNNLIVFCDRNGLQALGNTEEICALEPLGDKFRAFNWDCYEIDGHYKIDIIGKTEKPQIIICHTIKGKGVYFMENEVSWHYRNLTPELLEQAIKELD